MEVSGTVVAQRELLCSVLSRILWFGLVRTKESLGRPRGAWASWQPVRPSYSSFLQHAQERSLEHLGMLSLFKSYLNPAEI